MATRERTASVDYLDQPYEISLVRREEDDGARWIASVVEFPGCDARGDSQDEALEALRDAMRSWVDDAVEQGRTIPPPKSAATQSGKILLRMPPSLHSDLARRADREKVSLNTLIVGILGGAMAWPTGEAPASTAGRVAAPDPVEGAAPGGGARWMPAAATAGLIVATLAAVLAIVIVIAVLAW